MSDTDRLAGIKQTLHYWDAMYAQHGLAPLPPVVAAEASGRHINRAEIDWLVGEVEEWRQAAGAEANLADERAREVERLRGLLGRLEWAGRVCYDDYGATACCPACRVAFGMEADFEGHEPDCWLAAELAKQR